MSLTVHPSQDDYELQLTEQARLNPALVRHFRDIQGILLDAEALPKLAYGTARFDPHPVLDRLRHLTEGVRGISVEHRVLVSTFADLADIVEDEAVPARPPGALRPALGRARRRLRGARTAGHLPADRRAGPGR
jgi:hypothetical protein